VTRRLVTPPPEMSVEVTDLREMIERALRKPDRDIKQIVELEMLLVESGEEVDAISA